MNLSSTQQKYLDAFKQFTVNNHRTPTMRELAEAVGVAENAANLAVRQLVKRGYLKPVVPKCRYQKYALVEPRQERLMRWAREAASYLRRCNRFDLTRELDGILNETL